MRASLLSKLFSRQTYVVAAVASVLALFFASKDTLHQHSLGLSITWGKNLWWKAMEWYAWGLMAPWIFRVCRKFDFSAKPGRTVGVHIACGGATSLLHCCVLTTGARIEAQVLGTGLSWPALFQFIFPNHFHENVLTYAAIISAWYALDHYHRFKDRERHAAELQAHLVQARLQALKMQLHPHFLFNTLNGIAALIYDKPKAAHRMLARLSELLRITLDDEGTQEVSLRSELEFLRRYLELEQIRFDNRLLVELDIAPDTLTAAVPNLLLQPILENAIRHGIAPFSRVGQIRVHAHRNHDRLYLSVTDNGPGLPELNGASGRVGVGLTNTRARLRELYGQDHTIEIKNGQDGGLTVEIAIPFRLASCQGLPIVAEYEDPHLNRG